MLPAEHVFLPRELLDNSFGHANPTCGPKWTGGDKILMQRAIANMPGVSAGDFRCYATLLFAIHDSKTGLCVASAERGNVEPCAAAHRPGSIPKAFQSLRGPKAAGTLLAALNHSVRNAPAQRGSHCPRSG